MKNTYIFTALAILFAGTPSFAADPTKGVLEQEEAASQEIKDHAGWTALIQNQYSLTEQQMTAMRDQGLSNPQMAMVASLAAKSGKPLEEVLKMRTEQKLGWGRMSQVLGVEPKEIGQSVAHLRHQIREEHREQKTERRAERTERRSERQEQRQERRAEKHSEAKSGRGK